MDFRGSQLQLERLFLDNDYQGLLVAKQQHAAYIDVETCSNGSIISLSFPGYKATGINHDYRVDLTKRGLTTALSHANIIVDLFNKCANGGMSPIDLKKVLIDQACEGRTDFDSLVKALPYRNLDPSSALLEEAKIAHGRKQYNWYGNRHDLTLEELFTAMKWIVLQEDINYPMTNGFLGRKMPFIRYVETLHVVSTGGHNLQEVIQRALTHSRPPQWPDMDYSFVDLIK